MKNPKKAESLLEVTIALSVLMITLSWISSTLVSSMRMTKFSENRLVAESLSLEGIEGVKNIIYSNLFRLSEKKVNCWNAGFKNNSEPISDPEECGVKIGDPADFSNIQYFRLIKSANGIFILEKQTEALFTQDNADGTFADNLTDSGCTVGVTTPCFKNEPTKSAADIYGLSPDSAGFYMHDQPAPKFYRGIGIKYLDFNSDSTADAMKVISFIAFKDVGDYSYVVKNEIFGNYR